MMELHTLGDALIKVGEKEIRPTSPLVFAALLYLGMERGRRVSRAALQELLFPNASERSGAHSLRQLLYKLRQLGAPIEAEAGSVEVPVVSVTDSLSQTLADLHPALLEATSVAFLPNYAPTISEGFCNWVESSRNAANGQIAVRLEQLLTKGQEAGNDLSVARISSSLLKIDPLNERATLALAEAMARRGQKYAAVEMLTAYAGEVGQVSDKLRVSAETLRKRIEERLDAAARSRIPLVGREHELSWLLAQFRRSVEAEPTITVLWGEAGIGKSRLVQEFCTQLAFKRLRIETVLCQPHDVDRPLGAFVDIVPRLLNARGALGVSPESLECLSRLISDGTVDSAQATSDPDQLTAQIGIALGDLLASVASEGALVILVEDAHWLDRASIRLLLRSVPRHGPQLHILMTFRGRPALTEKRFADNVFLREMEPLDTGSSRTLLSVVAGDDFALSGSTLSDCVALAAGNPLFLCTIGEHLRLRGGTLPIRKELSELLKQRIRMLQAPSVLLLRVLAMLGNYGTYRRLFECSGLPDDLALLALQDVADRGLVWRRDDVVKCSHDLLADVVVAETPDALRAVLLERVAGVLERDGVTDRQIGMLYSCAECWRLAGRNDRALPVIRRCAAFALEIGQPAFAARILNEAQLLATNEDFTSLVLETIQAAASARQHALLKANVDKYEKVLKASGEELSPRGRHNTLRTWATQGLGESISPHLNDLAESARDASNSVEDRVLAARTFLIEVIQEQDAVQARRLYPVIRAISSASDSIPSACELRILYDTYFGSLDEAKSDALQLLHSAVGNELAHAGTIAKALMYSGLIDLARSLFEKNVAIAEKAELYNIAAKLCGQLAGLYAATGDFAAADVWAGRGEANLERCGQEYGALMLYHRVQMAMQGRNPAEAREKLAALRGHSEAKAAHARRTIAGLEILVAHLEGRLNPSSIDFEQLDRIDASGRHFVEHGVFAMALYVAHTVNGQPRTASECLAAYVTEHRRERYSLCPFFAVAPIDSEIKSRLLEQTQRLERKVNSRRDIAATL